MTSLVVNFFRVDFVSCMMHRWSFTLQLLVKVKMAARSSKRSAQNIWFLGTSNTSTLWNFFFYSVSQFRGQDLPSRYYIIIWGALKLNSI